MERGERVSAALNRAQPCCSCQLWETRGGCRTDTALCVGAVLCGAALLPCSVPSLGRRGYTFLKEEKGFSDTAIISGVLLLPLMFGALFICLLDALYTRRTLPFEPHEHYE